MWVAHAVDLGCAGGLIEAPLHEPYADSFRIRQLYAFSISNTLHIWVSPALCLEGFPRLVPARRHQLSATIIIC